MKKPLNVTINEEIIEQLKNNSDKGRLSEYTEQVLRAGLTALNETPKNTFTQLLCIAKKLNDDRKNGLIEFKG